MKKDSEISEKQKGKMVARAEKYRKEWLEKWNGDCLICQKPVPRSMRFKNGLPDMINGAVLGTYIEVYGHPACVQSVEHFVIKPNRQRFIEWGKMHTAFGGYLLRTEK